MGLVLLHEGQMHLEHNLKMLMTKMGVTPSNSLPSDASVRSTTSEVAQNIEGISAQTTKRTHSVGTPSVGRDLDGDFQMTEEVFDKVMADCSRARGPPPPKQQKVSSPINLAGGDDDL